MGDVVWRGQTDGSVDPEQDINWYSANFIGRKSFSIVFISLLQVCDPEGGEDAVFLLVRDCAGVPQHRLRGRGALQSARLARAVPL